MTKNNQKVDSEEYGSIGLFTTLFIPDLRPSAQTHLDHTAPDCSSPQHGHHPQTLYTWTTPPTLWRHSLSAYIHINIYMKVWERPFSFTFLKIVIENQQSLASTQDNIHEKCDLKGLKVSHGLKDLFCYCFWSKTIGWDNFEVLNKMWKWKQHFFLEIYKIHIIF